MKFSACIPMGTELERFPIMKKLGFNYAEPAFSAMYGATEEELNNFSAAMKEYGITCTAANGMFIEDVKLLEGKESYSKVAEYLDLVFSRAKKFGVTIGILGSGSARQIPEGMSKEEATERFCGLLTDVVSPYAKKYDIMVGIEELRAKECNFINSCKEAMEIIRAVDLPNIKLLVDYFHAILGGDTLEQLATYKDDIVHVHLASPINERSVPRENDLEDCRAFFTMLNNIGYNGLVSLEGRYYNDFESDITLAMDVMKRAL